MKNILSKTISSNGKILSLHAVSLQNETLPDFLYAVSKEAFSELSHFIKEEVQTLYIRDIKSLAIDGKYPGGHCYNRHEIMVSVPNWRVNKRQIVATINHELHHMARWQNGGYGKTLGGAILSEGLATYYEKLRSGWYPPWSKVRLTNNQLNKALQEWENDQYNHSEWFFKGPFGRWVGYSIGFKIVEALFEKGFDLEESILIRPEKVKAYLQKLCIDTL